MGDGTQADDDFLNLLRRAGAASHLEDFGAGGGASIALEEVPYRIRAHHNAVEAFRLANKRGKKSLCVPVSGGFLELREVYYLERTQEFEIECWEPLGYSHTMSVGDIRERIIERNSEPWWRKFEILRTRKPASA